MAMDVGGWNSGGSAVKTYQSGNREVKRITCYDKDGNVTGTMSISRTKKQDKAKMKKLNYNFKEVSSFLMKAKTSGSARRAVAMAQRKVIMLRKKLKKGEYNDQEVESALEHAKAIERAAKKHLKNLQKEERTKRRMQSEELKDEFFSEDEEKSYGNILQEAMQDSSERGSLTDGVQNMVQDAMAHGMPDSFEEQIAYGQEQLDRLTELVQQGVQETMEELLDDTVESVLVSGKGTFQMTEESLEIIPLKPEPEEFETKKKKHRSDVMRDIVEADNKYLKAFFDRLQKEKQSAAGGASGSFGNSGSSGLGFSNLSAGVSLELRGESVPVKTPPPAAATGGSVDVSV
ncbi:MAG: hypothetical protein HDR21_11520 [Lachnospiraceae bacterium]|nr:hypothetical protein [Lachnospiraceae bacterium]